MKAESFYYSAYEGSKKLTQQNIHTAKASGFGVAADDYAERGIDLNEQLIKNKPSTFFMRVNSDAMEQAGILAGDVVIVDRSLKEKDGSIIIAIVDGDLLIRKIEIKEESIKLYTCHKQPSIIDMTKKSLKVWGIVTYVIRSV